MTVEIKPDPPHSTECDDVTSTDVHCSFITTTNTTDTIYTVVVYAINDISEVASNNVTFDCKFFYC